jgi:hypothetical protein
MRKLISWTIVLVSSAAILGCMAHHGEDNSRETGIKAAAAGGSVDVEYLVPELLKASPIDPLKRTFPAKFVCGEAEIGDWHAPGSYRTVINILNISRSETKVQWFFTTFEKAFVLGATAVVPARGSVAMPCDFILTNLASAGLDVGGVTEGFVILEAEQGGLAPDNSVQVAVVYSFLHKQRHNLPDLVPIERNPRYCTLDDQGRLIVTIGNIGDVTAEASTTLISFDSQNFIRAAPELDPGEEAQLDAIEIPDVGETFMFTIIADQPGDIDETNELNNTAVGSCTIVQ